MPTNERGAYGAEDDIADYILGITYEIWEQGQVELIHQYYAEDCVVWGLDGITQGASAIIDATHATLESFPDRNLLAEAVIWSGDREQYSYSSHRIDSRGTNNGPTVFGPATGVKIRMTNIADCEVESGLITREWLMRDNMALAQQLGVDSFEAAREMAARRTDAHAAWMAAERERVNLQSTDVGMDLSSPLDDPEGFARCVHSALWHGDSQIRKQAYAPYAVLHRSPLRHYSGRESIVTYYDSLRRFIGDIRCNVDHVAWQPVGSSAMDIAVRWTVAGTHAGEHMGQVPDGRPVFILGATHWHCIAGRIARETTIFDDLAVLSQILQD